MNQLTPGIIKYSQLLSDIEAGRIKIPQFQRDFVWSKEASAKLLDSVVKRYPIGTFILWKTNETLRSIRNIGGLDFPPTTEGDFIQYVLDGQQRITSLYAGFKGCKIVDSKDKEVDYSEIYIDLEASEDDEIVVPEIDDTRSYAFIKITELLQGGLGLATKFDEKYHANIEDCKVRFAEYTYQTITVSEAPIDIATEIFTRVNIFGKSLSVFEIMVAKTFDVKSGFDLSEKYDQLIERLGEIDYETISHSTVLQSVSVCMVKECTTKHILKLNKNDFISIWPKVMYAFEAAAEYFKTFYRIPVSQLLPYDALLIPFTYYFFNHPDKPLGQQQKALLDFFWRTTINARYSSGQETKIAHDIKRMDSILADENVTYDEIADISPETISNNGYFSAGRAYIKGLLCLLAYQQPKSFIDNAIVIVSNSWLKQANSKNYHHFFPKAYLHKKGHEDFWVNHIANITIVDDFLNKRKIRDRAPSKYIEEFQKQNPELVEAFQSHLIGDIDDFGISNDDYDTFFNMRVKWFSRELKKRIMLTEKDVVKRNTSDG